MEIFNTKLEITNLKGKFEKIFLGISRGFVYTWTRERIWKFSGKGFENFVTLKIVLSILID